jgi:hypothetical protein
MDLRALVQSQRGFLFLPLIYRLAARLEQMSWEELTEDPVSSAFALRSAQQLFHLPAVITHFRIGVEAEACGADLGRDREGDWQQPRAGAAPEALGARTLEQAPLAQVLDVTGRLSAELRGQASTVGVVTGPRTLASLFSAPPPSLAEFYALLARAYAERGVALLLVVEDRRVAARQEAHAMAEGTVMAAFFNVARYFRLPTVLLDHATAGPVAGFDLTAGGGGRPTLPASILEAPPERPTEWRDAGAPLLLTEWEVPPHLSADRLIAWLDAFAKL